MGLSVLFSPALGAAKYALLQLDSATLAALTAAAPATEASSTAVNAAHKGQGDATPCFLTLIAPPLQTPAAATDTTTATATTTTDMVLVTAHHTYAVKQALSSNTTLVTTTRQDPSQDSFSIPSNTTTTTPSSSSSSNLQYLQVDAALFATLQISRIPPRLEFLKTALAASPYRGPQDELHEQLLDDGGDSKKRRLYTMDYFLNNIQASHAEIKTGIQELHAVEIDGYLRIIDPSYKRFLLEFIINTGIAEDLDLTHLQAERVVKIMDLEMKQDRMELDDEAVGCGGGGRGSSKVHPNAVLATLISFCDLVCHSPADNRNPLQDVYSLSYRKVCRFYGEALLKSQRTRDIAYDIDTFLNDWQKCIPQFLASTLSPTNTTSSSTTNNNNNIVPTLDMLDALYILTDDPGLARKTIHYFPKSQLIASTSTNNNNGGGGGGGNGDAQITIRKRFERLFREKKRWSLDELKPFIDDLVDLGGSGGGDGVKMSASQQQTTAAIAAAYEKRIEALVLKYARVAKNPNGGVSYTSRFTV